MKRRWGTSKLDLYNQHGERLCDAFGCRKHKTLYRVHGGWFCTRHSETLEQIRSELELIKLQPGSPYRYQREVQLRQQEMNFRKRADHGHCYYLLQLEENQEIE